MGIIKGSLMCYFSVKKFNKIKSYMVNYCREKY